MSAENEEKFRIEYEAGKAVFERGEYRTAVKRLEAASALVPRNSRLGGEARLWLVTAYQAAGQTSEAIALCEQLNSHPDLETSKQSKSLLYILKAPQLKRPAEWMTEIPDLGAIAESEPSYRRGTNTSTKPKRNPEEKLEAIDPTEINTKDNQFIWIALIASLMILGSLWFVR